MTSRLTLYPSALLIKLSQRRQALLVAMFVTLHVALMQDISSDIGRILMLPHFALFLLWQPFVSARSRISNTQILLTVAVFLMASFWMSWWLAGFWVILLAGMVGGRVFFYSGKATRFFYLLALAYLISVLVLVVMPHAVVTAALPDALLLPLIKIGGPVMIIVMALVPESREQDTAREAIDLAYSVFLMLMLAVLSLGSVTLMLLQQVDYIQALLITLFGMAVMLLIASWLWNPVAGFSGLGAVTSRYMLSIGLPFEQWIRSLAELAQRESEPETFIDRACQGMAQQLPWVSSCAWSDQEGKMGSPVASNDSADLKTVFQQGDVTLTLMTQQPLPPMLVWHFNLVAQLVTRFYVEKKRDRQLREMAYMQAVHETGARVTHDVKNLLQSLNALLFVVAESGEETNHRSQSLLKRQLPLIAQRLQQTLDKLRTPDMLQSELVAGNLWWNELQSRYEGRGVRFEAEGDVHQAVPAGLFTSAAENLLQNAFDKRAGEPGISIEVKLATSDALSSLSVRDTGSPLPADKAAEIGLRPVASENGLGIGLYQLARIAALANYTLELSANRPGDVCFSLRPTKPGE
jgi:signal transduction histidine kinase